MAPLGFFGTRELIFTAEIRVFDLEWSALSEPSCYETNHLQDFEPLGKK